jgi:hypothetical protein
LQFSRAGRERDGGPAGLGLGGWKASRENPPARQATVPLTFSCRTAAQEVPLLAAYPAPRTKVVEAHHACHRRLVSSCCHLHFVHLVHPGLPYFNCCRSLFTSTFGHGSRLYSSECVNTYSSVLRLSLLLCVSFIFSWKKTRGKIEKILLQKLLSLKSVITNGKSLLHYKTMARMVHPQRAESPEISRRFTIKSAR